MWRTFWTVICLLFCFSPSVWAQSAWEAPGGSEVDQNLRWERYGASYRIGLITAEGGTRQANIIEQYLRERLNETGGTLVPVASESEVESQAGAAEAVELRDGAQRLYFYEGPEVARDFLEDELADHTEISRRWMSDSERSAALYESILYLVRAHLDLNGRDEALIWMRRAVETFPAHQPGQNQFPPVVHELWTQVVEEVAEEDAILSFSKFARREQCGVYLNGAAITDTEILLAAEKSYLVGVECDGDPIARSGWVSLSAGQRREFFPVDEQTNEEELQDRLRQALEERHLDALVYLGPAACEGIDGETECVAIMGAAHGQQFSIRPVQEDDAEEVWAQVRPRSVELVPMEAPPQATWPMAAGIGGVTLLSSGIVWLAMTQRRARAFGCSSTTSATYSGEGCLSIEPMNFNDVEERADYARPLSWSRLAAGLTIAAGLSLSVGSAVGFVDRNRQVHLHAGAQGVGISVQY